MLLFNTIIILLLIHIIATYRLKIDILACGLFAFIGSSATKFNWDKFNYLGASNDIRGGDSCGIVTSDFYKYGIGVKSDYKDFVIQTDETLITKYKVVIGHTRKASVGAIDLSYAQPYIFTTKSRIVKKLKKKNSILQKFVDKNLHKETIVFAGVHNGTINNYKELAKEYGINFFDKNDSGVLMEIIFKHGFDVLAKYKGTAAIIIHNYAENLSYIFRGKSPVYSNTSITVEEKPLYAYCNSLNNTYLSSLEDSLKFIGGKKKTIEEVIPNILYIVQNGKIIKRIKIDRTAIPQKENYSTNINNRADCEYDYYSNQWEYIEKNKYLEKSKPDKSIILGKMHIMDEKHPYLDSAYGDKIYFYRGRYFIKEILIQGVIFLNSWGEKTFSLDNESKIYFFIDGVMLTDKNAYEKGLDAIKKHINDDRGLAKTLAPLSIYPVHSYYKDGKKQSQVQDFYKPSNEYIIHADNKIKIISGRTYFTGVFQPVFSKRIYTIRNGDLVRISEQSWFKTPAEEFGNFKNSFNKNIINSKTVVLPEFSTNNHSAVPCYDCKSYAQVDCTNCLKFNNYLENKNNETNIENSKNQILELNSSDTDIAYEEAYRELYEKQVKNLIKDCTDSLQEAIEELYSIGPISSSIELEEIFSMAKNSLSKFENKHF